MPTRTTILCQNYFVALPSHTSTQAISFKPLPNFPPQPQNFIPVTLTPRAPTLPAVKDSEIGAWKSREFSVGYEQVLPGHQHRALNSGKIEQNLPIRAHGSTVPRGHGAKGTFSHRRRNDKKGNLINARQYLKRRGLDCGVV